MTGLIGEERGRRNGDYVISLCEDKSVFSRRDASEEVHPIFIGYGRK